MNLSKVEYPTPMGKTADIVDADRDGGEGQPLIVARVFEPDVMPLFLAAPDLYAHAKAVLYDGELESLMVKAEEAGIDFNYEKLGAIISGLFLAIDKAEGK